MYCPQHKSDLIFPYPFRHFDICTEPFSTSSETFNSFSSHFPHMALTDIPHLLHSQVAIINSQILSHIKIVIFKLKL